MAEPASPLAALRRDEQHGVAVDGPAPVALTEAPAVAIVQVAAFDGAVPALAEALAPLGLAPLPEPGHARHLGDPAGGTAIAAVAPGRWLVLAFADAGLAERAAAAVAPEIGSAVDLGHARTRLILSGPRARDVLAKGMPIDVSADALPTGRVATSRFAHVTVQLRVLDGAVDAPVFELLAMSSYAATLWSDLVEAGEEWGIATR